MNRGTFSIGRVAWIAENTFREAVRQRLFLLLVLLAVAVSGGALLLSHRSFGAPEPGFLLDAGFGILTFFGSILAIVAMAQLFFSEIERRTVLTVLAKPVWRAEFVLGKLGGVLLLLLAFCVLGIVFLAGLLWWRQAAIAAAHSEAITNECRVSYAAVIAGGMVQWLRLGVLAAITLLVASYARNSLFAVVSGFFALVICNLQNLACQSYRLADSFWIRGTARLVGGILPDFELYDMVDRVTGVEPLSAGYLGGITLYSLFYLSAFSGLAVYCFRHREL
jgi:ABC-type transport system involved in multi-copper enzyme maturation permease subunit